MEHARNNNMLIIYTEGSTLKTRARMRLPSSTARVLPPLSRLETRTKAGLDQSVMASSSPRLQSTHKGLSSYCAAGG